MAVALASEKAAAERCRTGTSALRAATQVSTLLASIFGLMTCIRFDTKPLTSPPDMDSIVPLIGAIAEHA